MLNNVSIIVNITDDYIVEFLGYHVGQYKSYMPYDCVITIGCIVYIKYEIFYM